MAATVLIIDDDAMIRDYLGDVLRDDGFEILLAATGGEGEALLRAKPVDIVLLDVHLPDANGIVVLKKIKEIDPQVQVIILTAYSEVPSAVKAMQLGAYDYLAKPSDLMKLKSTISRALKELTMRREIERLRQKPGGNSHRWILGQTEAMRHIARLVNKVAQENTTVLIQGESGTGKEVVARTIQERSPRSDRPFVVINCAAIPETLLESELFGFEAGSFTSAKRRKKGLLEIADGGTLFLDEVSEMSPQMQAKILRVLETKKVRRIGGTTDIEVDVRFIAATNRDLKQAVRDGVMRADLYYRLTVVVLNLPPLRERKQDIRLFVDAFIDEFNRTMGKNITKVSEEALQQMRNYSWRGNIRELRNVIERAMVLCDGQEVQPMHLPAELSEMFFSLDDLGVLRLHIDIPNEGVSLEGLISQLEESLIRQALARADGNQSEAARLLSISRDQLRYRMEKYG
jgi:DNA-binding NtrC family response regulator